MFRNSRSAAKFELLSFRLYLSSFNEFGVKIVVIIRCTTLKSYNLWGNLSFNDLEYLLSRHYRGLGYVAEQVRTNLSDDDIEVYL